MGNVIRLLSTLALMSALHYNLNLLTMVALQEVGSAQPD